MANTVSIPFPIPSHGQATNSKLRVNLDAIVLGINNISNGLTNFNTLNVGTANVSNGTIQWYNSSNSHVLTITSELTATVDISYLLPTFGGSGSVTSASFVMTEGAQNINGTKLFTGIIGINVLGDFMYLYNSPGATFYSLNWDTPASNWKLNIKDPGANNSQFLFDHGNNTIAGTWTFSNALSLTATTNQLVLSGPTRTATISAPQPATSSRTYTFPDLSANYNVVGDAGTQTIGGSKTFSSAVLIADGSVGSPGWAFSADTDNGAYRIGANDWALVSGGAAFIELSASTISFLKDFDCGRASVGGTVQGQIENTDNTNAASGAKLVVNPGGTSAGDGWIEFHIPSGSDWSVGSDNSDSDKFKISQASTIGSNDALVISSSGPAVSIHGTITNDDAVAGNVGEYVSATASNTSFPANGVIGDLTSISLTAGDWNITGEIAAVKSPATTFTVFEGAISTTTGNSATGWVYGDNNLSQTPPTAGNDTSVVMSAWRQSLSTGKTVYLKYYAEYTGTAPKAYGRISARRVR